MIKVIDDIAKERPKRFGKVTQKLLRPTVIFCRHLV